jgi:hypothetical protein
MGTSHGMNLPPAVASERTEMARIRPGAVFDQLVLGKPTVASELFHETVEASPDYWLGRFAQAVSVTADFVGSEELKRLLAAFLDSPAASDSLQHLRPKEPS